MKETLQRKCKETEIKDEEEHEKNKTRTGKSSVTESGVKKASCKTLVQCKTV